MMTELGRQGLPKLPVDNHQLALDIQSGLSRVAALASAARFLIDEAQVPFNEPFTKRHAHNASNADLLLAILEETAEATSEIAVALESANMGARS